MAIRKKPGGRTTTKTTYTKTNRRGKTKDISEKKYTRRTSKLTSKGKAKKDGEYGLDLTKPNKVVRTKKETTTKTNKKGKAKKTSFGKTTVKTTVKPKRTKKAPVKGPKKSSGPAGKTIKGKTSYGSGTITFKSKKRV